MTPSPDAAPRSGLAPETFSPTVRPADDFFRYVNGPWLETHVIPDDRAGDGHFYRLRDLSEERVRAIIEDAPRTPRSARSTGASWTRSGATRSARRPSAPTSRSSTTRTTPDGSRPRPRRTRPLRGLGRRLPRGVGGPAATPTAWSCGSARAASGCRTRRTTASPAQGRAGQVRRARRSDGGTRRRRSRRGDLHRRGRPGVRDGDRVSTTGTS